VSGAGFPFRYLGHLGYFGYLLLIVGGRQVKISHDNAKKAGDSDANDKVSQHFEESFLGTNGCHSKKP
jgi:hypothetical protein